MVRVWRWLLAIAVAAVLLGGVVAVNTAAAQDDRPGQVTHATGVAQEPGIAALGDGSSVAGAIQEPGAGASGERFGATAAVQSDPQIRLVQRFSRLPEAPGTVSVELEYSIPSEVVSLGTHLPENGTVTGVRGFVRHNDSYYEWDGEGTRASVTYRYQVNRTVARSGADSANGTYLGAGVGDWALFVRPETDTDYAYVGTNRIVVDRISGVEGQGRTGEWLVYLGGHDTFTASTGNGSIDLVVPDAAEMAEDPRSILRSLTRGAEYLHVGSADDEVFAVAAPSDGVPWAVRGFQIGDADMWVLDRERLDAPESVWYHEFVHTRQSFETTRDARWLEEALPSYYATLLTFQHHDVSFDGFAAQLASGGTSAYDDAVLTAPDTWQGVADYYKGGLAVASLDREIRLATDGNRTFQDVFAALNDRERVNATTFVDAVERTGGADVGATAATVTDAESSLSMWNRTAHLAAFGRFPARVEYGLPDASAEDGYRVSGPYRETTVSPDSPIHVVTDETVTVGARVTNEGGSEGRYEAVLLLNGTRVDASTGAIGPNETRIVPLEHTFVFPGSYALSVDGTTVPVEVTEPARAEIADVEFEPRVVDQYDTEQVDVLVTNDNDGPAERQVIVTRDFDVVTRETVSLGANESRWVSIRMTFPQAGTSRIGVNREATIDVTVEPSPVSTETATPTATPTPTTSTPTATSTEETGPGFGVATLLAALALAALLARHRR